MGAINYGTANGFINLGVDLVEFDPDICQEAIEVMRDEIARIIDKYDFDGVNDLCKITIKPGYYAGFYLDFSWNLPDEFYNYKECSDCIHQIDKLRDCIIECINAGLVKYTPGWYTTYYEKRETQDALYKELYKLREELRTIPHWRR